MNTESLSDLGWHSFFSDQLTEPLPAQAFLARVIMHHMSHYDIITSFGLLKAELSGILRKSFDPKAIPAVGDWVVVEPDRTGQRSYIIRTLDRRTQFARRTAGKAERMQIIAANVDTVFIVTSLNLEFSARRIERFLVAILDSLAQPVIVLTKADLCPDPEPFLNELDICAKHVPRIVVSAPQNVGKESLRALVHPGCTVAFVGSSGVGKSTLVNWLLESNLQTVQDIREEDAKGKHTTTRRELIEMRDNIWLMDTPGMREIGLYEGNISVERVFEDIDSIRKECRFRNCQHHGEPGCAVRAAVEEGKLDEQRLKNYHKLNRELAFQSGRLDKAEMRLDRQRSKAITKHLRDHPKHQKRA